MWGTCDGMLKNAEKTRFLLQAPEAMRLNFYLATGLGSVDNRQTFINECE